MATLYKVDGSQQEVSPANGKAFTYKELRAFMDDETIQIVPLPDGRSIVVDDNGKLNGLEINPGATKLWCELYPIEKYPHNNDQLIVGPALVATEEELREEDEDECLHAVKLNTPSGWRCPECGAEGK